MQLVGVVHPQQSVRELFFRRGQRPPLAMNLKQVLPKALNADRICYQGLGPLLGSHQVREHALFQGRKPVQPDEFCHRQDGMNGIIRDMPLLELCLSLPYQYVHISISRAVRVSRFLILVISLLTW